MSNMYSSYSSFNSLNAFSGEKPRPIAFTIHSNFSMFNGFSDLCSSNVISPSFESMLIFIFVILTLVAFGHTQITLILELFWSWDFLVVFGFGLDIILATGVPISMGNRPGSLGDLLAADGHGLTQMFFCFFDTD